MTPPWLVVVGLLVVCVSAIPVDLKFREASLQSQEVAANEEIAAISTRIQMLQHVNRLAYDTTLFSRKLRWLIRKSLSGKPDVTDVQELMKRELELSQAHVAVAVEGVADELKLEIKHGIIALQAGLDFVLQNYVPGTSAESDAAVAKIKANLAALEARFGVLNTSGATGSATGPSEAASTAAAGEEASSTAQESVASSSAAAETPASSSAAVAAAESSSAAAAAAETGESSTAAESSGSTGEAPPPAPAAESSTAAGSEPSTGNTAATGESTPTPPSSDTTSTNPTPSVELSSSSSAVNSTSSSSAAAEETAAAATAAASTL